MGRQRPRDKIKKFFKDTWDMVVEFKDVVLDEIQNSKLFELAMDIMDSPAMKVIGPIMTIVAGAMAPWAVSAIISAAAVNGAVTVPALLVSYEAYKAGAAIKKTKDLLDNDEEKNTEESLAQIFDLFRSPDAKKENRKDEEAKRIAKQILIDKTQKNKDWAAAYTNEISQKMKKIPVEDVLETPEWQPYFSKMEKEWWIREEDRIRRMFVSNEEWLKGEDERKRKREEDAKACPL